MAALFHRCGTGVKNASPESRTLQNLYSVVTGTFRTCEFVKAVCDELLLVGKEQGL
jgi:hypothetical protein